MTSVLLLRSIHQFLTEKVEHYTATQGENKKFQKPTVWEWNISPQMKEDRENESNRPYIIPHPISGEDGEQKNRDFSYITVNIHVGIYSDSLGKGGQNIGGYDLLNLMDYIRFCLQQEEFLERRYHLEKMKWEAPLYEGEYWDGVIQTLWSLPKVQSLPDAHLFG